MRREIPASGPPGRPYRTRTGQSGAQRVAESWPEAEPSWVRRPSTGEGLEYCRAVAVWCRCAQSNQAE